MSILKRALVSVAVAVFAGTSAFAQSAPDAVMDHLRGFGALDAAAMTAPFSDDAVLVTPERVYSGKAEILEFMEALVAEFSQDGISTETLAMQSDGGVFLMTWRAESPDNMYEFGSDTFVVDGDKIVLMTSAAKTVAK